MLSRVLVCARLADPGARPVAERRLAELARWYGALGPVAADVRWLPRLGMLAGVLDLAPEPPAEAVERRLRGGRPWAERAPGAGEPDAGEPVAGRTALHQEDGPATFAWGSAAPPGLLDAPDARLRTLPVPLAAVAVAGERARIACPAGGVASLHHGAGDGIEAWSSHAVAAAWLATGAARLRPAAVAELLVHEHPAGDAAAIDGVRVLDPATVVEIAPGGARERCFWAPSERWSPLPERDAAAAAAARLLADLDARLASAPAPVLGLTAGADSLVAAVALRELGIAFAAFTHGDPGGADAAGARRVAAALGAPHAGGPYAWWEDAGGLERLRAAVRWHEAGAPAGYGDVPWPAPLSHWIAGIGGEAGRAFWYRDLVRARGEPPRRLLEAILAAHAEPFAAGAEPEARRRLRAARRALLDRAAAAGAHGWRTLDVAYAEGRVRRWGRGVLPRLGAELVPAFAGQEMLRALSSLPLADRLGDGFARRFVAERALALAPPAPPVTPRAALARRLAAQRARALRRAAGLPPLGRGGERPWFAEPPWTERPAYVGWLDEVVLRSPLLASALGERWLGELRGLHRAGRPHAAALVLRGAAAVALGDALAELGRA